MTKWWPCGKSTLLLMCGGRSDGNPTDATWELRSWYASYISVTSTPSRSVTPRKLASLSFFNW
eukprot:10488302-Prorocentrum_lima.AAC.1